MKPLNINKRAAIQRDMAMKEEALNILESMRQEEMAGVFDPALVERNRRIINGTIDDSRVAPYNTVKGSQIEGLGIDGPFKPDSDVRVSTVYADTGDPLLDDSVRQYGIRELGVNTEYLSPTTRERLFRQSGKRDQAAFNRVLGEYYGQQALKLAGNTPVPDNMRSTNVQRFADNPNSTLGTDRLIETQRSVMGRDVGPPAGDYRYLDPTGALRVGDYQVATYMDPRKIPVKLQMIKESTVPPAARKAFVEELQSAAKGRKSIDDALGAMIDAGVLPTPTQASYKYTDPKDRPNRYMRAGKMTSDGERMGVRNIPILQGGQHRYDNVLFGIQKADRLSRPGGEVPQAFMQVDASKARDYLAMLANKGELMEGPSRIGIGDDGSVFTNTPLRDLLDAGVATNLAAANPQVMQLL